MPESQSKMETLELWSTSQVLQRLGYRMADVKKFPRARGRGLCSGIEQIREEYVLDDEATRR
jgi:hypothetical protein